jgi:hypothetical protein
MSVITYETYVKTLTDMELVRKARALYSAIYRVDCFNGRDIALLSALQRELQMRGYKLAETSELVITK